MRVFTLPTEENMLLLSLHLDAQQCKSSLSCFCLNHSGSVQGSWIASANWNWIVDPLNGDKFIKVAEVQGTETKVCFGIILLYGPFCVHEKVENIIQLHLIFLTFLNINKKSQLLLCYI